MLHEYTMVIETSGGGAATVYFGSRIKGRIYAIKYEFGDMVNTADFVITGETSEVPIFAYTDVPAADAWFYPRVKPVLNTAGQTTFTNVSEYIRVFRERIKLVVAQGGASKTGSMTIWVDEEP